MKKIFIYAGGCELRFLDAQKILRYMEKNGNKIVINPRDADVIIFVSCGVVNQVAEYSLQKVKEFQKYDAELIVAGCLPGIEKNKLKEIFTGKTIVTEEIDKIDALFPECKYSFKKLEDANIPFEITYEKGFLGLLYSISNRSKYLKKFHIKIEGGVLKKYFGQNSLPYRIFKERPYHLRIGWGCMGNCSYCAIKSAVGPMKSKPMNICLKEFELGFRSRYKHFLITADEVGAYGIDINSSFPDLLEKIIEFSGDFDIAIRNFSPRWLVKYIDRIEKILQCKKIVHLDVQIQSGSNRILKLMNRYSNVDKILETFNRVKLANPNISIDTQCIIGFPSESDNEFEQTLEMIKNVRFASGSLVPFSSRVNSLASGMESKISDDKILERMKKARNFLRKIGYKTSYKTKPHFLGFDRKVKK